MFFPPYFILSIQTFSLVPFFVGSEVGATIWLGVLRVETVKGKTTTLSSGSATWSAASSASMLSSLGMDLRISFRPARI